jgi:tetratricopeptide (TPR) repeat protein
MSLARALELRAQCDYRGALDALAAAETRDELVARSQLYEELGAYALARADAERAEDPVRLAGVALAERRPEEALELVGDLPCVERAAALEELLRLAEAGELLLALPDDDPLVRSGRGGIKRARGEYEAAEQELLEALRLADEQFGSWSIEAAAVLNALGMTYKYWGRFEDGLRVYTRSLAIVERAFGSEHPDVATLHHNLGGLAHAARRFDEAEPHARQSVELRRRLFGPDHVSTAEDEAAWAPILHALGRDEEARALLEHAIPILEAELGDEHPEVAGAWNNLGSTLEGAEAAEAYRRALATKERSLGPEHPALAITLNNLAINARRRGAFDEAEEHYRRALAILEARVEPDHPSILLTRRNFDRLQEEQKKMDSSAVYQDG